MDREVVQQKLESLPLSVTVVVSATETARPTPSFRHRSFRPHCFEGIPSQSGGCTTDH